MNSLVKFIDIKNRKNIKLLERENYIINNDILYKLEKIKGEERYLVCIPKDLWFDVLYTFHDDIYGAHLGLD